MGDQEDLRASRPLAVSRSLATPTVRALATTRSAVAVASPSRTELDYLRDREAVREHGRPQCSRRESRRAIRARRAEWREGRTCARRGVG
jgi:Ni/Co efflux regulator RcnB